MDANVIVRTVGLAQNWRSMSVEEMLIWLLKYGKPKVIFYGKGWGAQVDMYVNTRGTEFKISSGIEEPDPKTALIYTIERLAETLHQLGELAK